MNQKGFGIVEIVVTVAMISAVFVGILQLFKLQLENERAKRDELRGYAFLAEAMEGVRSVRDEAWANLSSLTLGSNYYPVIVGSAWSLTSVNPGPIDGYTRWIVLNSVLRDGSGNIAVAGSTDPKTLRVTATVEWLSGGATKTRSITTYLTNWQSP